MDFATYKYYKKLEEWENIIRHVCLSREDATELGNEIYRFFKAIQPKYLKNGKFIRQYEVLFDKLLDIERLLRGYRIIDYEINIDKINLKDVRNRLDDNKDLLINLISNGNLLEHETFTEMLMSIMHLREELNTRLSMDMQEYELEHIEKDIMLAYKYLTIEWAEYMK